MIKRSYIMIVLYWLSAINSFSQETQTPAQVINEFSPSKAVYFDWINRNWYGSNQKKIEANLRFFKWLHDEYGMQLDIYLMDAGDIDQGPNCADAHGLSTYGSLETAWFKKRFPDGFASLVELARSFNCRLGIWLGPDGYGATAEEASKRKEMLVKFCKEYNFALFKFDACCSDLTSENQHHFIETMKECRRHSPDLIVLNHRITLNDEARKYTTTFLWEGRETYVDVNISNDIPAPHHRASNLSRGVPPNLNRLTEDHGVCFSSALDAWDDDLILQAFNRNLILSPEIYGNPFLLNDDELSRLARIYNIHRLYNDILVKGIILPEEQYGKFAVSRGDQSTRLITMRNLSWQPVQVPVKLDESIGLSIKGDVEVLQYHPTEKFLGKYKPGETLNVTVDPFRACLIKVSTQPNQETILKGVNYQVKKYLPDQPVKTDLLGRAGETVRFSVSGTDRHFKKAKLNGKALPGLKNGKQVSYTFPGIKKDVQGLKKLGNMQLTQVPSNSQKLMEMCLFTADNNALEVRELLKSGVTHIPAVQDCRDAFFQDTIFTGIGAWDLFAFDGDPFTSFKVRRFDYRNMNENNGAFRLDMGEPLTLDKLLLKGVPEDFNPERIEISTDLSDWKQVNHVKDKHQITIIPSPGTSFRYLRIMKSPFSLAEIEGYHNETIVSRKKWRASNLFGINESDSAKLCWSYKGEITGIGKDARLAVTVPVKCNEGSIFALLLADGEIIVANDRAPSFLYNNWEHFSIPGINFTFFIPVPTRLEGKKIEVMLISTDGNLADMQPEVWIMNQNLFEKAELILE